MLDFNEARKFFYAVIEDFRRQNAWPFEGYEEECIAEAFSRLDSDKSGKISFEEFASGKVLLWTEDQERVWRVSAAFDSLDTDKSKSICRDELEKWMKIALGADQIYQTYNIGGREITMIEAAFNAADSNGSGTISKTEFIKYFARPNGPNMKTVIAMCDAAHSFGPKYHKK
eukprot:TRINITY_DN465_c0_g1_i1.p2 TRINITY_DN465_c0_g1~~TRINITY_DN465_c0_g1_i1.p2  ORF type:complete len:172 (+),score=83.05 TRINITY_DN465_c0_g1_i1:232-747(+)